MRLPSWFGGGQTNDIAEGEIKQLTDQFHITLRAHLSRIQALDGQRTPGTLQRLNELLNSNRPHSWSEAYESEQLFVQLYDEETLKTELDVRGLEAQAALRPPLAAVYAKQITDANSVEKRRGLLARLVNDLQWRYTVNEVKRRYSQDITSRTGGLFAFALFLFAVWIAYMVLSNAAPRDLHLLIFAALAGTWGATFSMLGSLKSRLEKSELDELKLMRPWVMLLSRALIGTGAGCVLYFLLRSGLLGGSAFPDLAALDTTPEITRKGLALLIIWCFIAGFSEKLVPSILEKTEGRAGGTPDRFRPGPNGSAPGSTTPNVSEPAGGTAQDPPAVATAQPTDGSRPMDGASRPGLS